MYWLEKNYNISQKDQNLNNYSFKTKFLKHYICHYMTKEINFTPAGTWYPQSSMSSARHLDIAVRGT